MDHLLHWSKSSIFHNIFKYIIFQSRQKALLWGKVLNLLKKQIRINWYFENNKEKVHLENINLQLMLKNLQDLRALKHGEGFNIPM